MLRTFARGDAAVCVLAVAGGVEVEVVDVGVDADPVPGVVDAKVRRGSRNLVREPAMTDAELDAALAAGRAAAARAADAGVRALGLGEMGIGNTTSASALLCALTGAAPAVAVGRGTGVDDARLAHKRAVVERALARHADAIHGTDGVPPDAAAALPALGGLEIAALAGAARAAAERRVVVVVDGFIATVAALVAAHLDAAVCPALVFAHRSAEAGHGLALDAFRAHGMPAEQVRPLLDLGLRLGEGTGGALAVPLVRAAARMLAEMATFASAGVSGASGRDAAA
jgi:nicotinate-nucleotide--dimethylbenzimidazole phosphoribosyltransferase